MARVSTENEASSTAKAACAAALLLASPLLRAQKPAAPRWRRPRGVPSPRSDHVRAPKQGVRRTIASKKGRFLQGRSGPGTRIKRVCICRAEIADAVEGFERARSDGRGLGISRDGRKNRCKAVQQGVILRHLRGPDAITRDGKPRRRVLIPVFPGERRSLATATRDQSACERVCPEAHPHPVSDLALRTRRDSRERDLHSRRRHADEKWLAGGRGPDIVANIVR